MKYSFWFYTVAYFSPFPVRVLFIRFDGLCEHLHVTCDILVPKCIVLCIHILKTISYFSTSSCSSLLVVANISDF